MKRKEVIQDMIKVSTQCGNCGEWVKLMYHRSFKRWEQVCPQCDLNLSVEIQTPQIKFHSDDYKKIKECSNCGKKWMHTHTCKTPDIPIIIQKLTNKRNIKELNSRCM